MRRSKGFARFYFDREPPAAGGCAVVTAVNKERTGGDRRQRSLTDSDPILIGHRSEGKVCVRERQLNALGCLRDPREVGRCKVVGVQPPGASRFMAEYGLGRRRGLESFEQV
jgi:hypothetical protein